MKKKILFINGHMNCGGVEKSLLDILKHIDYSQYDIDLLLFEEIGDYEQEIPSRVNIILKSLKNTYGAWWKCLLRCTEQSDWFSLKMRLVFMICRLFGQDKLSLARRILSLPSYDTVIAFRSGICTLTAAYAIEAKKKITWWHHGEINVDRREYSEVLKSFDKIIAVSNPCLHMMEEAFPEIQSKLMVIPNLIDVDEIKQKAKMGKGGQKENNYTSIVTVCRISPEKHVENILYSAERLKKTDVQFHWTIVGGGALLPEMEMYARQKHLANTVSFVGMKRNPYPILSEADLYVHPSYIESQGISILEALSLNIPCVVTESLGPREYIVDGENGILTAKGDRALYEGILKMLHDKELYKSIKQNSRCPSQFLPETVMKQIESIL